MAFTLVCHVCGHKLKLFDSSIKKRKGMILEHPMVDVHHIQWLFVETENGGQLRYLAPGQAPKAVFELGSEKPVAVYAYCNLHGLWMTKL